MSFRGREHRGSRGFGGRGSRGQGRVFGSGRGAGTHKFEPPETLVLLGTYTNSAQEDLICSSEIEDVPYFNAPVYLDNKEEIGKVDEIFGNVRNYFVSVQLGDNYRVADFQIQQKLYVDPAKLISIERFVPRLVPTNRGAGAQEGANSRGGRSVQEGGYSRSGGSRRGVGSRFGGGGGRFGRSNAASRGFADVQGYGNRGFGIIRGDGNRGFTNDRSNGNRGYWRGCSENDRGYGSVNRSRDGLSRGNNFGRGYRGDTGRIFRGGRGSGGGFGRGGAANTYFR